MEKTEIISKLNNSKKLLESIRTDLMTSHGMSKRCVECIYLQNSIKIIEKLIKDLMKRLDTNDSNIQ